MHHPGKSRRQRYYAYALRAGGTLWLGRTLHALLQERPHAVTRHQCSHYLGKSRLLTPEECRAANQVHAAL